MEIMETVAKKPRIEVSRPLPADNHCHHYVERKKRYCKMTLAKGMQYCGEHLGQKPPNVKEMGNKDIVRVPCPLDGNHTVYESRLAKHLKICNARPKDQPEFIETGVNSGSISEAEQPDDSPALKISDLDHDHLATLIAKVNGMYDKYSPANVISEKYSHHPALDEDISKPELGQETLKHLKQTAALLGSLERTELLQPDTCYIEFGAGKGQFSFYLSKCLRTCPKSEVVLIDRASHRHKKDNRVEEKETVHRVRADIADLCLQKLPQVADKCRIVGISKHLCGAATDLALRCLVNGRIAEQSQAVLIAVCCHHRCSWHEFVGRDLFEENGITSTDFQTISKMVSWAVCGSGMSRERRRLIEDGVLGEPENNDDEKMSREEKEEIGYKCKRVIDFGRLNYLRKSGYTAELFYYIGNEITLENVCIFARRE